MWQGSLAVIRVPPRASSRELMHWFDHLRQYGISDDGLTCGWRKRGMGAAWWGSEDFLDKKYGANLIF
jgi:hypothetical protein